MLFIVCTHFFICFTKPDKFLPAPTGISAMGMVVFTERYAVRFLSISGSKRIPKRIGIKQFFNCYHIIWQHLEFGFMYFLSYVGVI